MLLGGIDYHTEDEANGQKVKLDQTELGAPPLRSEINKIKRIRISEIKNDNVCKYCKKVNCKCLDKCYNNCNNHFQHCVCYTYCLECNNEPSDCICLLKCEYCHTKVMRKTFIAQETQCDCVTVAATSMAEKLADNHVSIEDQDDVGSLVQDRLDKYDLHPSPHGT